MIEKIKRALIIKYTIIISCILFLGFATSYTAYRHVGIKLLRDSLRDYLTEELWEAKKEVLRGIQGPEIHKVMSDIQSLHNFTYWLVDNKIVRAEHPCNDEATQKLERRLLSKHYKSGKIYHENIKVFSPQKQKWYFLLMKKELKIDSPHKVEVFVLANYTPVRKNARAYVKIALLAAVAVIILSYFIGSFFASRSMKYIEQSYRKQKQFVSDAAHEFRTPPTILYSYAELLEYNPQKKQTIIDIKNEVQQMSDMIDRLLAIARYDNSKAIVHKEWFSLNELAADAVNSLSNLCPADTFTISADAPNIKIFADKVMIRQLFGILLDNAIKYTGDDKKITVSLLSAAGSVKIKIKDNGIGIKKENLPYIFDRFWRAETSRHQKGLGLGLSLAETIVHLHKGTINVESEPGRGTEFCITLPTKKR